MERPFDLSETGAADAVTTVIVLSYGYGDADPRQSRRDRAVASSSSWKLRSWDEFRIPKPFARVHVVYGAPLHFSKDIGRVEATQVLQQHLDAVSDAARC